MSYLPLTELNNEKYHFTDDIIIIQRMAHLITKVSENKRMPNGLENFDIRTIFKNNKIIIWCHDFITSGILLGDPIKNDGFYFENDSFRESLNILNNDGNTTLVCVSEFQKNKFIDLCNSVDYNINCDKLKVIHNALYSEYFKKEEYTCNKNNLCYLSSWTKGIEKVLHLFDELLKKDASFILYLLTPGYEALSKNEKYIQELQSKYDKNIKILNKQSKHELSRIIGESLCLLGPKYEETFGCVYQEAYHLHTPVILDKNCGGSLEIVSKESVIDFNNTDEFIDRILDLKKNREIVQLNEKFYDKVILKLWNELLE